MKLHDIKILTDENISPKIDVFPGTILVIEDTRIRIRHLSKEL